MFAPAIFATTKRRRASSNDGVFGRAAPNRWPSGFLPFLARVVLLLLSMAIHIGVLLALAMSPVWLT